MKRMLVSLFLLVALAVFATAQGYLNRNDGPLDVSLVAETGFVKVLTHTIQIGENADVLDYVADGGQEILFPFNRYTAELAIANRHTVIFLFQPLEIATQIRLDDPLAVDDVTFPEDSGMNLVYSFPFYRVSYLYDFARSERLELAAGVSLQLRNASLRFESLQGTGDPDGDIVVSQDLGPVPIIKLRGEYHFAGNRIPGAFVALEADGFYASSAFINGADFEFTGSIFDASLRAGFEPAPGIEVFTNVRGLGGGGAGTRPDENRIYGTQSRSGFTDNFLTTLSLTLGARVR